MLYSKLMTDPNVQAKAIAVQTQEEERYRIAHLLQSGPAQILANAALEIETCLKLMNDQPDTAREGLSSLLLELRQGLKDLRGLITDLQPPLLNELGLAAGLVKYVEAFTKHTGIVVELHGWEALTLRLPTTVEVSLFRIIQEALDNVREHARTSHAQVTLELGSDQLIVTIVDNGQGFDRPHNMTPGRRLGLVTMRDRAEVLGGNLQIFTEPGHGVRVVLTAPTRTSISTSD
jgi:two-component system, NarL family, sensor histidine kinase DegS